MTNRVTLRCVYIYKSLHASERILITVCFKIKATLYLCHYYICFLYESVLHLRLAPYLNYNRIMTKNHSFELQVKQPKNLGHLYPFEFTVNHCTKCDALIRCVMIKSIRNQTSKDPSNKK